MFEAEKLLREGNNQRNSSQDRDLMWISLFG